MGHDIDLIDIYSQARDERLARGEGRVEADRYAREQTQLRWNDVTSTWLPSQPSAPNQPWDTPRIRRASPDRVRDLNQAQIGATPQGCPICGVVLFATPYGWMCAKARCAYRQPYVTGSQ